MYSPPAATTIPPMVGVATPSVGWLQGQPFSINFSSATYESASRAVYYPITLPAPCTVRRVWWANGATTTGGATIEVGIYADAGYSPGAKVLSGSATQGTASQVQFVDVTDTTLPVGLWWVAIVSSSATNTTVFRTLISGTQIDALYRYEQASASPLPASATPVQSSIGYIWLCGFATTASP